MKVIIIMLLMVSGNVFAKGLEEKNDTVIPKWVCQAILKDDQTGQVLRKTELEVFGNNITTQRVGNEYYFKESDETGSTLAIVDIKTRSGTLKFLDEKGQVFLTGIVKNCK